MKIEAGQVAVVTGGTRGIGLALAALLVRRGVDVMIADVREDAIPVAVDALSGHVGRVVGVGVDVGVEAGREHAVIGPGAAEVARRRVAALLADLA